MFCDLSEDMLAVAKKRLQKYEGKVSFIQSSAEEFRLPRKVDCIYISGAMHHFENPAKAVRNCYRHLLEGGVLIVCEPVVTNPYAWPRVLFMPEEHGQFWVTPGHIVKWMGVSRFAVLEKKWMHYKSSCRLFRFLLRLEKAPFMNWSAVMFAAAARKGTAEGKARV